MPMTHERAARPVGCPSVMSSARDRPAMTPMTGTAVAVNGESEGRSTCASTRGNQQNRCLAQAFRRLPAPSRRAGVDGRAGVSRFGARGVAF
jgi:hypothetical protein